MKRFYWALIVFLLLSNCNEKNDQIKLITPENFQLVENTGQITDREYSGLYLSPDGNSFAATGEAGVSIFDTETLEQKQFFPTRPWGWLIGWSPTGQLIAIREGDDQISLKDPSSGDHIFSFSRVNHLSFSPSEIYIAMIAGNGDLSIWDIQAEKEISGIYGNNNTGSSLAWSPDETELAILMGEDSLTIWKIDTDESRIVENLTSSRVRKIAWSPDGKKLAVSSRATTTILETTTLETLAVLKRYPGDEPFAVELIWFDEMDYFATIHAPFMDFNLWDTSNWEPANDWQSDVVFDESSSIPDSNMSMDWHQINNQVVFTSATYPRIGIWDVSLEEVIYLDQTGEFFTDAIWNKDGTRILSITWDSGDIQVWGIP